MEKKIFIAEYWKREQKVFKDIRGANDFLEDFGEEPEDIKDRAVIFATEERKVERQPYRPTGFER